MTTPAVPNPLVALDAVGLWNAQLLLAITCNGGKYKAGKSARHAICGLANALLIEADNRGLPSPQAPFHIGDLKKLAL